MSIIIFLVVVTKEKKADLERKQSARCVFECRVFGQKGVGKVLTDVFVYSEQVQLVFLQLETLCQTWSL